MRSLNFYHNRNIQIVEEGISRDIVDFIEDFTTLVVGFIIAIVINWKLALVVGSFFPVIVAAIIITQKVYYTMARQTFPYIYILDNYNIKCY